MAKIDEFFRAMKEKGASDLHMVIGRPPLLRLGGKLVPLENQPELTPESNQEILFEILPHLGSLEAVSTIILDLIHTTSATTVTRIYISPPTTTALGAATSYHALSARHPPRSRTPRRRPRG